MAELVERYVRQVGRYLPRSERAEIEAELRSLIQDQLDDRYGAAPADDEVAALLQEFGAPRQIAASYSSGQYLIGPGLYPYLMMVLRRGWLIIPAIVVFLNLLGALAASQPVHLPRLILDTTSGALQATALFSGVVVLFFAIIQHSNGAEDEIEKAFDPLELPAVNDPRAVDRVEALVGSAIGLVALLVLLYFLYAGGLTLRFNLSDPGAVLPVPVAWLALLVVTVSVEIAVQVWVLRRNRWSVGLWGFETAVEIFGVFCLYFAVYQPIFERFVVDRPGLAGAPIPELIVVATALPILIGRGSRLVSLWSDRNRSAAPFRTQADG